MTNMITNAGEDDIPPGIDIKTEGQMGSDDTYKQRPEGGDRVGSGEGQNTPAFIEWALNSTGTAVGRVERRVGLRTIAMDQNTASSLDGGIDKRLSPAKEQGPFNRTREGAPFRLRWKVPNEILFLRVRKIYDHIFEDIRESWFNRKCLFCVSNAHPVSERVSPLNEPLRSRVGGVGGTYTWVTPSP